MRHALTLETLRQVLAAAAVVVLATTTTIAQENKESNEEAKPAANAEQIEGNETAQADTEEAGTEEADAEQEKRVVLHTIELKTMAVNDFLSAAELAGAVDRRASYGTSRQRFSTQQRADDQQRLFVATKPDSSLLFVRGPEEKVNKVAELAKKLDVASEKMPEKLQFENGKQARRVPKDEMNDTREVLRSLGFETTLSTFGDAHFLVFDDTDETNVQQIEQVLDKLSEGRKKEEKVEKDAKQKEQEKKSEKDKVEGDVEGES